MVRYVHFGVLLCIFTQSRGCAVQFGDDDSGESPTLFSRERVLRGWVEREASVQNWKSFWKAKRDWKHFALT